MNNPFTPTFGIVPPYLAGRKQILEDMDKAFDNWPGDPNLSTILIGPRGSGKTAMLSCIGDIALRKGWIVADTSAADGMLEDVLQRTMDVAAEHIGREDKRKLTGIEIGSVLGLNWSVDSVTSANWRSRISELLKRLNERGIGLLITIDEVRSDVDEMIAFATVYQHLIREGAKVALAMAGLPIHVSELLSEKSVSFLRRSKQRYLGRISDTDIRSAFRQTVESAGKEIDNNALESCVEASGGFAYMMQLVGYQIWDASSSRKIISTEDANHGIQIAKDDFKSGVLRSTYRELSNGDISFLNAMLKDSEESSVSEIAERMNKKPGYVSTYKKRLMQAGVIEETGKSKVAFAIPMFRDFLEEQE